MECTVLRDEIMEVLYGQADAATARRVEEHEAVCAACRDEMAALRRLRHTLGVWRAPEFGRTRLRRLGGSGLRGLAVAAALLLALGAATGSAFRLGRGAGEGDVKSLLAEQEARHRDEIQALRASLAAVTTAAPRDDASLLKRVEEMIRESEARQAVLLNASFADFGERAEASRRYDLARVSAGLSYLDGKNGQQTARTTELVGYVLQAAQQR